MGAQAAAGAALAVAEIPLLYETGHEGDFDCVVVTACDAAEQLRRTIGRSGISEDDARRRIAAQWPLADKVRRADFVIAHRRDHRRDTPAGARGVRGAGPAC